MWFADSLRTIILLSLLGIMVNGCGGGAEVVTPSANPYDGNWTPQYSVVRAPSPEVCITPVSAILTITKGTGSISYTETCIDTLTSAITRYVPLSIGVEISSAGVVNITGNSSYTGTCSGTANCYAGNTMALSSYTLKRTTAQLPLPASPPVASYLSIKGTAHTGQTLTGAYFYSDPNDDQEGISTYRWYRNGVAIVGATNLTYTLTSADLNALIGFEVTPIAQTGSYLTGTPVDIYYTSPISAGIVQGGLAWSDAKAGYVHNWADADSYCANNTINALTGWRLPTISELNSYMLSDEGRSSYFSGETYWSSTLSMSSGYHEAIYKFSALSSTSIRSSLDSALNYTVCVR